MVPNRGNVFLHNAHWTGKMVAIYTCVIPSLEEGILWDCTHENINTVVQYRQTYVWITPLHPKTKQGGNKHIFNFNVFFFRLRHNRILVHCMQNIYIQHKANELQMLTPVFVYISSRLHTHANLNLTQQPLKIQKPMSHSIEEHVTENKFFPPQRNPGLHKKGVLTVAIGLD